MTAEMTDAPRDDGDAETVHRVCRVIKGDCANCPAWTVEKSDGERYMRGCYMQALEAVNTVETGNPWRKIENVKAPWVALTRQPTLTLAHVAQLIERQPWTVDEHGSSESVPHDTAMIIAADILAAVYPGSFTDVPGLAAPSDEAAFEAAAKAICDDEWEGSQPWDRKPESFKNRYRSYARAAIAAYFARASTTAGGARTDAEREAADEAAKLALGSWRKSLRGEEVEAFHSRLALANGAYLDGFEAGRSAAPTSPARNDGAGREGGTAWFIVCNPREVPFQKCCPRGDSAKFIRELYEANPGARIVSLTADFDRNGPMPDDAGAHLLELDFRAAPRVRKWHAADAPDELREAAGALLSSHSGDEDGFTRVLTSRFAALPPRHGGQRGGEAVSELTYDERRIIRHTTGLDRSKTAYRNFFAADRGHQDMPILEALDARGLMVRETSASVPGFTFRVTAAGMQALKKDTAP